MLIFTLTCAALFLAFCGGAWILFSSMRPQPEPETFCVKCGNVLPGADAAFCPKCRRVLTPEMQVTCTRSALVPGQIVIGMIVVVAVAALAAWLLPATWPKPPATSL